MRAYVCACVHVVQERAAESERELAERKEQAERAQQAQVPWVAASHVLSKFVLVSHVLLKFVLVLPLFAFDEYPGYPQFRV